MSVIRRPTGKISRKVMGKRKGGLA
jgi:hypothetical protein